MPTSSPHPGDTEKTSLEVSVVDGLHRVEAASWDALCGDDDPFTEHAFLLGLEESKSVGPSETGWVPRHILVRREGRLVAAAPLYEKYDSYGEYIFDWGWARAAEQARISYYPKLVASIPFTPATGSRLLVANGEDPTVMTAAIVRGMREVGDLAAASSIHLLFLTESEQEALTAHGFMPRSSYQFHWENSQGWNSFDDYLGSLKSSVRKQIRKERRRAASNNVTIRVLRGPELGEAEWKALWEFYCSTTGRKWAIPYLTPEFFHCMRDKLAHRVVGAFAHEGDTPVAGALLFSKGKHLYGRYWGTKRRLDCMHFELCYYAPIEWALNNGITRFEAGAQGQHKLKRGFLPSLCRSAHWMRHPALAEAIAEFLPREAHGVDYEIQRLAEHSPFKCKG